MQWPLSDPSLMAQERQRELLASAADPRSRREPGAHTPPPAGWRRIIWLAGHLLERLGQQVEELAAVNGHA